MKNLISTIATIALFLVVSSNAFAQVTAPVGFTAMVAPTGNNLNDTVTIGSVMPYQVTGDANMHLLRGLGILNYSNYTKTAVGGVVRAASGLAASTPNATDSAFSVIWNTLGAQTVSVTEVPVVASGPAFTCTANTQTLNIAVIARPTAAFGAAASASGCGVANTTVTIPYTLTGTGLFDVTYRIRFTPLSGAASDVVSTTTNSLGNLSASTQSFTFSYAVPAAAYGRYDVFISNVTDRISRKSGITTSDVADVPEAAGEALTFYAYPTPVTQPIQHIKNL